MSKLREAERDLAADFAVLDEGKRPSLLKSIGLLGGAAVAALLAVLLLGRRSA